VAPISPELEGIAIRERYAQALVQIPLEDRQVLAKHYDAVTKSAHPVVMEAFVSDDPARRQYAVTQFVAMAKAAESATAPTPEAQAAAVAAKQATMVATGSQRPVAVGESGSSDNVYGVDLDTLSPEERTEAITKAFHKQLFETETTSVMDGLARGRETP
jgi:hypothetical protein